MTAALPKSRIIGKFGASYAANDADRTGLEEVGGHIFRHLAVFDGTILRDGGVQDDFIRLVGGEVVRKSLWDC